MVGALAATAFLALHARGRVVKQRSLWGAAPGDVVPTGWDGREQHVEVSGLDAVEPVERLVEAIAGWRATFPDARRVLVDAAVNMLVAGDEHPAVQELASLYSDAEQVTFDALVDRVVVELDLQESLSGDMDTIAMRSLCRSVVLGTLEPRVFVAWVHQRFGHDGRSDPIDELAGLDDEFEGVIAGWYQGSVQELDTRVRDIAAQLFRTA